jgi:small subunit ribosomal protein S20
MPNIKSAKKRVLVISTKTLRNQMIKTNLKTCIKNFESCVAENNKEKAIEAYKLAIKKIDQAVAKGILHKNTAARKKSQLSLKFNKIA